MTFFSCGQSAALLLLGFGLSLSSCDRNSVRLRELEEENGRLKRALEGFRGSVAPLAGDVEKVDLNLTMAELWSQRFEDTEVRARRRLDQKLIRVTAPVASVSERSVTLFGVGRGVGSVNLVAQFDESYSRRVGDSLANIRVGSVVTVQGRFSFEKMSMERAFLLNRISGHRLESADLAILEMEPNSASSEGGRQSTVKTPLGLGNTTPTPSP